MENKKLQKFSNFKKHLFSLSLMHNIENGLNESQLIKLNELLNRSINDKDDVTSMENNSNVEVEEVSEFYKRKERRRFTKLINKQDKKKSRNTGKQIALKDNFLNLSTRSLRSRINNSIERRERTVTVFKMLKDIGEANTKIVEGMDTLNQKIKNSQEKDKFGLSEVEENLISKSDQDVISKNSIDKFEKHKTEESQ